MYTKRYLGLLALALSLPLAALAAPAHQPFVPGSSANAYSPSTQFAPLTANPDLETIPGAYMVVLKDGVSSADFFAHQGLISSAQLSANGFHGEDAEGIRHVYDLEGHLQGYAGKFTDDVLDYIRAQPEVEYVEMDSRVSIEVMPQAEDKTWDVQYDADLGQAALSVMNTDKVGAYDIEKGAPWGLARISHRKRLGLSTFNKYVYQGDGGEGVTAYIIDTGININHVEFEGRARWGKTMPQNDVDEDGNGHGTHCAGTIGSRKYGVAKKADLVAVKVLGSGGSGSMSDVTGGVLWAVDDAKKLTAQFRANPRSAAAKKHKGFVANMSLGGGKSITLDKAVNGAVTAACTLASPQATRTMTPATSRPPAHPTPSPSAPPPSGRARLLLQQGQVRRHLCARPQHPLHLEHGQHLGQHHLGHLDGQPAHCRPARLSALDLRHRRLQAARWRPGGPPLDRRRRGLARLEALERASHPRHGA